MWVTRWPTFSSWSCTSSAMVWIWRGLEPEQTRKKSVKPLDDLSSLSSEMSVAFFSSAARKAAMTCFWISLLLIHPRSFVDSHFIYIFSDAGAHIFIESASGRDSLADLGSRHVHFDRVQQVQTNTGVDEFSARGALGKRLHDVRGRSQ